MPFDYTKNEEPDNFEDLETDSVDEEEPVYVCPLPQTLDFIKSDKLSLEIIAILAQKPSTAFSVRYIQKELGTKTQEEVMDRMENMVNLNLLEYGGIGSRDNGTIGYNISAYALMGPLRNQFL